MSKSDLALRRVLPKNYLESLLRAFPVDWNVKRPYRLPSGSLGPYYIEWQSGSGPYGENWDNAPLDAEGTLLSGSARSYHPIRIAQFGLHSHARWCVTRASADHAAFLAQARWLAANARDRAGVPGCLIYEFPWPKYGASIGWISAMAQGEAISLLLRAADAQGDATFREAAVRLAQPFRFDVSKGGVVYRTPYGDAFLEEAAVLPASHILNGHIFALWGLLELRSALTEPWLAELADAALGTLRRRLPLYDAGYWSYYNLLATGSGFRSVALLKYHAFHIAQLRVTAALTGDAYFSVIADRWQGYADSTWCRLRVLANTAAGLVPSLLKSDRVGRGAMDLLEALGSKASAEHPQEAFKADAAERPTC
jgi:heparosan-N-sulfate-glucuronate 5-epimerase